jgi:hypothetical protein
MGDGVRVGVGILGTHYEKVKGFGGSLWRMKDLWRNWGI